MSGMLFIVTCSVGGRLKALYDDFVTPVPERLESLLRILEERQSKPPVDSSDPSKGDGSCSATAHRRRS